MAISLYGQNGQYICLGRAAFIRNPPMTFSIWIKPRIIDINNPIFFMGTSTGYKCYIDTSNKINVGVFDRIINGWQIITGTTTVVANTWYHICFTIGANSLYLYVNGTSEGSANPGGFTGKIKCTAGDRDRFYIGRGVISGTNYGNFSFENFSVWKKQLSVGEILQLAKSFNKKAPLWIKSSSLSFPLLSPDVGLGYEDPDL